MPLRLLRYHDVGRVANRSAPRALWSTIGRLYRTAHEKILAVKLILLRQPGVVCAGYVSAIKKPLILTPSPHQSKMPGPFDCRLEQTNLIENSDENSTTGSALFYFGLEFTSFIKNRGEPKTHLPLQVSKHTTFSIYYSHSIRILWVARFANQINGVAKDKSI